MDNSMKLFAQFCLSFNHDFITEVNWHCSTDHMVSKWKNAYQTAGTYGAMIAFWAELDETNCEALCDYIMQREEQRLARS
jgi:hypothetical protein